MVMVLHARAASNNHSTILWDISRVTHASIHREWLNVVIHVHVYNSMMVSTQQYKHMLISGAFFKTQSDQNIHQNTPNCTIFSKFSQKS